MKSNKLNIGCGNNILPGWVNLDISALPGVGIVHNIEELPLPFPDEYFDEVLCQDILEHVEYIPVLRDIFRIMKKDGILSVRVPHFTSKHNFIDPTHKKMFSINTFDFFVKNSFQQYGRGYYFDFNFTFCREAKIVFERGSLIFLFNPFIEKLVNLSARMQKIYESTFLARFFPACNILVTLIK
jgi:ubiquinone/menaquinone biosynthesis C-methylase UbiE